MAFDPYWEWLQIPVNRRPPGGRELLGVGPDETDLKRIDEAAQRRRDHLKKYDIAPQEEVAAAARRLLAEVGDAVAALRRSLTTSQPGQLGGTGIVPVLPGPTGPQPGARHPSGSPGEPLLTPIILGPAEPGRGAVSGSQVPPLVVAWSADQAAHPASAAAPTAAASPPPLPFAQMAAESVVHIPPPPAIIPVVPPPIPLRADHGKGMGEAPPAKDALPIDSEGNVVPVPSGLRAWSVDTEGNLVPVPPPPRKETPSQPREPPFREVLVLSFIDVLVGLGRVLVGAARAVARSVVRIVRRIDGVLRRIAGEENVILHGFLRVLVLAALSAALASGVWLLVTPTPPEIKEPSEATGQEEVPASPGASAEDEAKQPPATSRAADQSPNTFTNSIGMRLILIPAGEFTMGSGDGPADQRPPHPVRITKRFYTLRGQ